MTNILPFPALLLSAIFVLTSLAVADEEFVGPFASWRNLKQAYGAIGDGHADDTGALQHALDDLTTHTNFCVLFIPAGTYRLTGTVKTVRKRHTDCQGIAVVGESPHNTVLKWDGPTNGVVFQYDAWYSKISRLTIDGAGRARVGLRYGPAFSTYNETSDLVLRDAAVGMLFGGDQSQGQAENEVLRCQFLRCSDAGLMTAGYNCMDIWVWYSRFEDCGNALMNNAGNFHAWQNLFLRSRIADIGTHNLMVFSFVNNTSVGSRRFLDFEGGHSWGSPTTISGNRILDPTDDFPLRLGNGGPYLVMDNVFKLPPGTTNRTAKMTWGDQTFLGNTYSTTNAVREGGRFRRIDEKTVDPKTIDSTWPRMPSVPGPGKREVLEVMAGADGSRIQQALDQAALLRGHRPIVHLPMGIYTVAQTLVIPSESDVQIVGDGAAETGTRLNWKGPDGGVLLQLQGPSRATLRDVFLHAPNGRALLVEDADQSGGRIFADQLNVSGPLAPAIQPGSRTATATSALRVNGLKQTDVLLRCLQGSGNSGTWVEVIGAVTKDQGPRTRDQGLPSRDSRPLNQVSIFTGATGSAQGQYSVRNGGHLVVRGLYHEKSGDTLHGLSLADAGMLAIDASRFSYKTSPQSPLVALNGFRGLFTLATSLLMPVDSTNTCRFELTGHGDSTDALALNDLFWVNEPSPTLDTVWLNRAMPRAHGGLIGCNLNSGLKTFKGGFGFLDETWMASDAPPAAKATFANHLNLPDEALLRHIQPLRTAKVWFPEKTIAHSTDVQIYRVMVIGGPEAAVEFRGN